VRCLRDDTPLEVAAGPLPARCPRCAGAWGVRPALEAAAGGPLLTRAASLELADDSPLDVPSLTSGDIPRCLECRARLGAEESRVAVGQEILACGGCGRVWLDGPILAAISAHHARETERARIRAEELERRVERAIRADDPSGAALPASALELPARLELAALPVAFVLAWALVATPFGELVSYVPRLQFHELGHAMAAWWSGRRALPLPIGFTVWSEERSWLLIGLEATFTGLLALHGVRERAPLPLVFAAVFMVAIAAGLATPLERSEPWVIAAGQIGETLLPALVVAAFHLPLPRRLRWDFWRWIVGLVALFALASVIRTGWQIAGGTRPLPYGSFVGDQSDGDLNRLIDQYGFTEEGLRSLFGWLATAAFGIAFGTHFAVAGRRWWRERAPLPARAADA
jgi:hypothetical protein